MVSEWKEISLGNLVTIKHGWPFKSDCYSMERKGRPIVVSVGNFRYTGGFRFSETTIKEYADSYPTEYELKPGEILLIMTCQTAGGEILGVPARVPNDGNVYLHNQRLGRVVLNDPRQVSDEFLYWLFIWPEFNRVLVANASGTKILHTSPGRIEKFSFKLPPLSEQLAIANILNALENKIELNHRMNSTLEAMAQAIFKSWFVDFDPVRAKSEGRAPHGMDAETAALFPSEFEESEMGMIPKGWGVGIIANISITERRNISPSEINSEACYIALEHMPRKSIALDNWSNATQIESSKFIFNKGDILFGKLRPYFHKVGIAPISGVCSTDILVIKPSNKIWFGLTLCNLCSDELISYADRLSNGAKMPRVKWEDIANYRIILPPNTIAEKFSNLVRAITENIFSNIYSSKTLSEIRDLLLPRLISGRLRIPNIEEAEGGLE